MSEMPPLWPGKNRVVAQHQDEKRGWALLHLFCHWLLLSWWCPCCVEERKQRKRKV